jgi:mono/diheme cytochrome c family protein
MRSVIHFVAVLALTMPGVAAVAADNQVARGEYLVRIGGCNDCHTPGYFLGKPDPARFLAGSDVGFDLPGMGTFIGPNLTPDNETGLGSWSRDQIITAIQTGVRPDGRILSDHAVARVRWIDEIRRRRDCRLSQKSAAGQPQGTGAVWIRRQATGASNDGGLSGR